MKTIFPLLLIILLFYFAYLILIGLGFKDFKSIVDWWFDGIPNLIKPKLYKRKPKYILFGLLGFAFLVVAVYLFYPLLLISR